MAGRAFVSRFSPNRTDPEVLEAIFVQRHRLAEMWLERLRESVLSGTRHHLLAVGPRGSGKSHLVVLLLHRLRKDPAVTEQVRIAWLPEDETTPSFWKFLLRILRALNAEYGDEFPPPPRDLLDRKSDVERADVLGRHLLEKLDGRVLLVVVENLDDVMRGLKPEGQRRWRAFLQESRAAATLATAQQLTKDLSSRDKPFFNFFQIEHLQPLTADEALSLLRKLADQSGNTRLSEFLQTPTGRARVRAIRHLTGGSHRVFIILSEFATRENLDNLVTAFEELLDELTPYYQERLRWLPDQQREIVEFLCRQSRTVQVKEIAAELFLTEQTAAAQLKNLRDKGYVIAASVGRESRYELAEPLMRLCVEIKDPQREPIRLIVEFLRVWYDQEVLESRLECLPAHAHLERRYLRAVLQSYQPTGRNPLEEALELDLKAARVSEDPECLVRVLTDLVATSNSSDQCAIYGSELFNLQRYGEALLASERALHLDSNDAILWANKGWALLRLERPTEALESFEEAARLRENCLTAWTGKGTTLWALGRHSEAIVVFETAIKIQPNEPTIWYYYGYNLLLLGRDAEALVAFNKAAEIDPNDSGAWAYVACSLNHLKHHDRAMLACDRALQLNPDDASALGERGRALLGLGRPGEAIQDFDRLDEMNSTTCESLAEAYLLQGDWDSAERTISRRFAFADHSKSWHLPDFLIKLFCVTIDTADRKKRVAILTQLAWNAQSVQQIQQTEQAKPSRSRVWDTPELVTPLALLGDALVRTLKETVYADASAEALDSWLEGWRNSAEQYPDLALSIRLFEVGLRYVRTRDERVLLDLVQEERAILRDLFGLDEDVPQ